MFVIKEVVNNHVVFVRTDLSVQDDRIEIRINSQLKKLILKVCEEWQIKTITEFIIKLAIWFLIKKNYLIDENPQPKVYGTFEDWGWEGKPKLKKVI